jgi:DNA-binding NtrC family response regulator
VTDRILVIEDEMAALRALSALLSDEGYEVLEAACGQAGLALAMQELPDLILLDIRLPDINGLGILGRLRQAHNDAAVLIMTADTTSSNVIQATRLGAFDHITKPINDEHLLVLRVIEEKTIERLGSNTPINVDFRLIAATSQDLPSMAKAGKFREISITG